MALQCRAREIWSQASARNTTENCFVISAITNSLDRTLWGPHRQQQQQQQQLHLSHHHPRQCFLLMSNIVLATAVWHIPTHCEYLWLLFAQTIIRIWNWDPGTDFPRRLWFIPQNLTSFFTQQLRFPYKWSKFERHMGRFFVLCTMCIARYCYSKSSVRPSVCSVDVPWPYKLG